MGKLFKPNYIQLAQYQATHYKSLKVIFSFIFIIIIIINPMKAFLSLAKQVMYKKMFIVNLSVGKSTLQSLMVSSIFCKAIYILITDSHENKTVDCLNFPKNLYKNWVSNIMETQSLNVACYSKE